MINSFWKCYMNYKLLYKHNVLLCNSVLFNSINNFPYHKTFWQNIFIHLLSPLYSIAPIRAFSPICLASSEIFGPYPIIMQTAAAAGSGKGCTGPSHWTSPWDMLSSKCVTSLGLGCCCYILFSLAVLASCCCYNKLLHIEWFKINLFSYNFGGSKS